MCDKLDNRQAFPIRWRNARHFHITSTYFWSLIVLKICCKVVRTPLSKQKVEKIEALRSRPRRRPDWSDMMKEVESGRKLKHVQCNDRSAPVLPQMKAKGQVNKQFLKSKVKQREH